MSMKSPYIDQLIMGDCLEVLTRLPEASVDLVFADPPYNLQLQQELWRPNLTHVDAVDDEWDQVGDFQAYDQFTRDWLLATRRVMRPTATIWISGTYHNIFRVGTILQDLGFWILNTVTWFKPNAMPNFRGTRLKNDVEFVIWAKGSEKSTYVFNHHEMKQFNERKQLGSVWTIPVCAGPERLRDEQGRKLHSTQKPEELLTRIILASSLPGNVVLDPFVGTGTTTAVAKRLRRHWLGIERDSKYIKAAQERVDKIQPLDESDPLLWHTSQNKPERIPFKRLVEQGYVYVGQELYLDKPNYTAVVLENGDIKGNGFVGSIHKLGAQLKNAPSCNGWMHWYFTDNNSGQILPLDVLREKMRNNQRRLQST